MWSAKQTKAFQTAVSTADKHERALDALRQIAAISPAFADTVADLVTLHTHTRLLAETALAVALQALPTSSDDQTKVQ